MLASDASVAASAPDASALPPVVSDAGSSASRCTSPDPDLSVLVECTSQEPEDASMAGSDLSALDVHLTAVPARVAPSGVAELRMSVVNTSTAPVTLWLVPTEEEDWHITTVDALGVPALPPKPDEEYHGGACDPDRTPDPLAGRLRRAVLAPGATTHARIDWRAIGLAWTAPDFCGRHYPEEKGPLAVGHYTVTLTLPLVGDTRRASTTIDVAAP
jgi:hypothetical protein